MAEKEILEKLCSHQKLDRDKGVDELKALLQGGSTENKMTPSILSTLKTGSTWEAKHGCLMAAQLLIEHDKSTSLDSEILPLLPQLLEDNEPRVRLSAGEVLGCICRVRGPAAFEQIKGTIVSGITSYLERDANATQSEEVKQLADKLIQEQGVPCDVANIFHDTAGWKALESYMNALKYAAEGCGSKFHPHITQDLLQLLFRTLSHTNRFVRETAFYVLAAIVLCLEQLKQQGSVSSDLLTLIAKSLALGLSDNWSQVRMAACVATRQFFTTMGSVDAVYLDILIPAMCLNRYYVAEGVRVYSQQTWLTVTKNQGVHLVEERISSVVAFYVAQSSADNHAVREAACACIAELGSKVSKDILSPHVAKLLSTLLVCFKDECWPVRDAACLACGNFVSCFPAECLPKWEEILSLCLINLEDSISSIRQGAAISVAQMIQTYGDDVFENVLSILKTRLPLVKDQPQEDMSQSVYDDSPATFGVVKRVHDNDPRLHSDQQMYSCGSLAPKMRKGRSDTGEMTGGESLFQKTAQPWEKSEGCIHLLAEIVKLKTYNSQVASLLPILAEMTRYKHYAHHRGYFETMLKLLPVIAQSLGKKEFKKHFDIFIDAIFYSISCDSALVQAAATDCIIQLTQIIGKMITRGRIEQHNMRYLDAFDKIVR
ncbi:uncharacterized protein [Dysidea avara]|uniref:uncharacterized protein n=1 Tax=Dysidea avara TaxID=196820 RepID=UPI00331B50A4